ncbi:uncharacterized protein B0P05DRAFT_369828 [Gilbertella persicaria]|uniref:uncharacterized protein n=1 Tax=Gilbertella persicaria TaxID=101096 RepID=UPI00221EF668|nr:uncharacterized protein B0P05DRAFT_369828 [Gilbertella persicaria]KAI8087651.1 hypothetical protein B0P05DRAFT_369828 [Gilbertella persicaria]
MIRSSSSDQALFFSMSKAFPHDPSDPFQQNTTSENSDIVFWPSSDTSKTVPRWNLKTVEEEHEQAKVISKLESKIATIKSRSDAYYTQQKVYDQIQINNDDEQEQDIEEQEEEEEGLPLLWKNKAIPIDQVSKKSESQYTTHWCCCYFL